MKKRIFSMLAVLVLLLAIVVTPAMAVDGTYLGATTGTGTEARIVVPVPAGTTLGDIQSIAWQEYLIQGYPPHIDILLDLSSIPDGIADDALVVEYAYNTTTHYAEGQITGDTAYGALKDAWYATFNDDTNGPVKVTMASNAWLTSQLSGPLTAAEAAGSIYGSLSSGFYFTTLEAWVAGAYVLGIDADTPVVELHIEVDNWIMSTEAYVQGIEVGLNGASVDVGVSIVADPDVVAISVSPSAIDFGELQPGDPPKVGDIVTVINTGTVPVNITISVVQTVGTAFLDHLTWSTSVVPIPVSSSGTATPTLTIPSDEPLGAQSATIIFWAEDAS